MANELDWSLMSANDVDQRVAIVAYLPSGSPRYDQIAFLESLQAVVSAAVAPPLNQDFSITPYQVGPAAEWFPVFLVTLRDYGPEVLQTAADLVEVATAAFAVAKALREWKSREEQELDPIPGVPAKLPVLSLPVIAGMCLSHFGEHYGPIDGITLHAHSRTLNDYGTAQHPSGIETYTLAIESVPQTFVYMVNGYCEALDHFVVENGQLTPLSLPNWLEREYFPQTDAYVPEGICLE
jgi:hypothetical protein